MWGVVKRVSQASNRAATTVRSRLSVASKSSQAQQGKLDATAEEEEGGSEPGAPEGEVLLPWAEEDVEPTAVPRLEDGGVVDGKAQKPTWHEDQAAYEAHHATDHLRTAAAGPLQEVQGMPDPPPIESAASDGVDGEAKAPKMKKKVSVKAKAKSGAGGSPEEAGEVLAGPRKSAAGKAISKRSISTPASGPPADVENGRRSVMTVEFGPPRKSVAASPPAAPAAAGKAAKGKPDAPDDVPAAGSPTGSPRGARKSTTKKMSKRSVSTPATAPPPPAPDNPRRSIMTVEFSAPRPAPPEAPAPRKSVKGSDSAGGGAGRASVVGVDFLVKARKSVTAVKPLDQGTIARQSVITVEFSAPRPPPPANNSAPGATGKRASSRGSIMQADFATMLENSKVFQSIGEVAVPASRGQGDGRRTSQLSGGSAGSLVGAGRRTSRGSVVSIQEEGWLMLKRHDADVWVKVLCTANSRELAYESAEEKGQIMLQPVNGMQPEFLLFRDADDRDEAAAFRDRHPYGFVVRAGLPLYFDAGSELTLHQWSRALRRILAPPTPSSASTTPVSTHTQPLLPLPTPVDEQASPGGPQHGSGPGEIGAPFRWLRVEAPQVTLHGAPDRSAPVLAFAAADELLQARVQEATDRAGRRWAELSPFEAWHRHIDRPRRAFVPLCAESDGSTGELVEVPRDQWPPLDIAERCGVPWLVRDVAALRPPPAEARYLCSWDPGPSLAAIQAGAHGGALQAASGGSSAAKAEPRGRVAACTLVPAGTTQAVLEGWLLYHLYIGLERLYMFFEAPDTSSARKCMDSLKRTALAAAAASGSGQEVSLQEMTEEWWATTRKHSRFFAMQEDWAKAVVAAAQLPEGVEARQQICCDLAMQDAQSDGMGWLVHLGAHEFLYLPSAGFRRNAVAFFRNVAPEVELLKFQNHESVPESMEAKDLLQEVTLFKSSTRFVRQEGEIWPAQEDEEGAEAEVEVVEEEQVEEQEAEEVVLPRRSVRFLEQNKRKNGSTASDSSEPPHAPPPSAAASSSRASTSSALRRQPNAERPAPPPPAPPAPAPPPPPPAPEPVPAEMLEVSLTQPRRANAAPLSAAADDILLPTGTAYTRTVAPVIARRTDLCSRLNLPQVGSLFLGHEHGRCAVRLTRAAPLGRQAKGATAKQEEELVLLPNGGHSFVCLREGSRRGLLCWWLDGPSAPVVLHYAHCSFADWAQARPEGLGSLPVHRAARELAKAGRPADLEHFFQIFMLGNSFGELPYLCCHGLVLRINGVQEIIAAARASAAAGPAPAVVPANVGVPAADTVVSAPPPPAGPAATAAAEGEGTGGGAPAAAAGGGVGGPPADGARKGKVSVKVKPRKVDGPAALKEGESARA